MKKKSNTIAQEQKETSKKVNKKKVHVDEAVSDHSENLNEESEFIYAERIAYYCDLTGFPIYL